LINFFDTLLNISLSFVVMTWLGYPVALYILRFFLRKEETGVDLSKDNAVMSIAILVAAYNEENIIKQRIDNLLSLIIPDNVRCYIYVLSDGSNDKTVEYAKLYGDKVLVREFDRVGRAEMHNKTIQSINEDIVIFTDAETIFDRDFIKNILMQFQDEKTGVVVGHLKYRNLNQTISESEGLYWKYERQLRRLENDLGILSNGTGAAMAVRKELCGPMNPGEDIDTAIPIQMVIKNKKVVYEWSAIAYDNAIDNLNSSFVSKSRGAAQTIFCWKFFFRFPIFLLHPLILLSFIFHRLLRYLTFLFLLLMYISIVYLGIFRSDLLDIAMLVVSSSMVSIILLVLYGKIEDSRICKGLTSLVLSFAGMFIGLIKGFLGMSPSKY